MNHDALIRRINALGQACQHMARVIASFDHVLVKENEAIGRSNIKELEAITQEKVFFGSKLEEADLEIRKQMNSLYSVLEFPEAERERILIERLIAELRKLPPETLNPAFVQANDFLSNALDELKQARTAVFPKIEANAYMVKKLLQYHRETYAFWQAVAQQSEAVYGKTGKSVSGTQKSILTVRT